jgi:hypothetical protein
LKPEPTILLNGKPGDLCQPVLAKGRVSCSSFLPDPPHGRFWMSVSGIVMSLLSNSLLVRFFAPA